ncbi:nuclear receptor coactivator 2-like isoform X2 [Limulus polyphemus]|uniref:Nuclear receptor coactivator 2-like isoform X2 n=1 Tax=Limulus polyphemus TaxID=6850 RepID=A0ABM1T057_LIMPO|nr:nuclear receptor coactivator 2-like isoform X2 [Limulus polyphemus]
MISSCDVFILLYPNMSLASNATVEKSSTTDNLQQLTLNKCLNDRLQESICFGELAELISASLADMSSLSVKPEKCAIIQETVSQIHRIQKQATGESDELQESEVSSSNSSILNSEILGPLLLEALDGFLLLVNTDGKIEVVSENISYFLKYTKDDLVGKSIYNIIHVGDHARFSSNLLPMSIGNGFSWNTEPGIGTSKSRTFNCRFLIKALEDPDESMEEKQTRVSHYESMQISTVLLPHPAEHSDNSEAEATDAQNFLFCVARRIPSNEQNQGSPGIEQFTTRLDMTGKILAIDTSGVSSTYSQYLNKDLVERIIQGLCDPKDLHKLNQHLKETLQVGSNTSGIYRLRVAPEKYIHVQTRSKRVACNPLTNEQEFVMATHSIIRDPDFPNVSQRNGTPFISGNSSPSSSMGTGVYTSPTTLSAVVSGPSSSSLYSSLTSLPSSSHEISFDDFGFELFSSSNWEISSGNDREVLSSSNTVPSSSPVTTASSESNVRVTLSAVQQAQLSTNVLSTEILPVAHSPAPQMTSPSNAGVGRVTPLSTYTYSSLQGSPSSGRATPVLSELKKVEDELCVISDVNSVNRDISLITFSEHHTPARTNHPKLRNVLTQGVEDRKSSAEVTFFSKMFGDDGSSQSSNNIGSENGLVMKGMSIVTGDESSNTSSKNVILRELLNQDEDAISEFKPHFSSGDTKSGMSSTGMESLRNDISKATSKRPVNNNNMLRKLLNSEVESTRSNRRSQDMLIQQLLKAESPEKVENSVCGDTNSQSSSTDQLLKDLCINSNQSSNSSSLPTSLNEVFSSLSKRKSDDNPDSGFNPPSKRPAVQHPHLAGQNPMLASMLAQTPKTEPSVPTTIANSIMSQLPQDRLPKNLEKKLIQTPCTVMTSASSNSSTQQGTGHTISTNHSLHPQDVVAVDPQGQVAPSHHPVNTLNLNQRQTAQTQPHQQQHQGFLSRILNSSDGSQLTRVLAAASASATSSNQSIQNTYSHYQLPSQLAQQTTKSITLSDLLADVSSFDSVVGLTAQSQTSDPMLSQILDEVWSMQQEMEPSPIDDNMIRKILDEVFEQPSGSSSSGSMPSNNQPVKTVHDVHEKLAISAIQQQLMSYEISTSSTTTTSHVAAPVHTQTSGEALGVLTPSNTVVSFSSPNYPSAPSMSTYTSGAQNGLRVRGQNPGTPISVQQCVSLGNFQHPISGGGFTSSLSPEVYHKLLERRQKMLQHQKRLRVQQQQKQIVTEPLTSASSSALSENMNDLLNNTVAPNVTLQRFNSVPDQQLSSRYNASLLGQTNQSQVSPGQQSPYSPLSQQPFPSPSPPVSNSFSQHRLPSYSSSTIPVTGGGPHSPHLQALSSQPQWNQRNVSNSVQHQNPMLNAQLSQNLLNGQGRFVAQARQVQVQSMPSPNSITNQRNLRFPRPSDSQFQPQSPGHFYQQAPQAPPKQQRMQRALSVPGAVNSPRTPQGGFVGSDQIVSSQAQISPGYTNQLTPGNNYTPTSGTSEISRFSFDQQSLQMYGSSSIESRGQGTGNSTGGMTSEYVRQELRAMVGAKTQQQQAQSQQLHQYSLSGGNNSGVSASTPSQQIFNQVELDALVLSLDIGTGDGSPGSPRLFPSPLGSSVSRVTSHSPRGEEPKPTDHTKSLLQQLLQHTPEPC